MRAFERHKSEILGRIEILDLVSEHVTLKRSGQRFVGLCPFHSEKTPSFTVRPEHGYFKCFGCGKGGDIFSFVQFRENVDFMEAMHILADRAGVELDDAGERKPGEPTRADLARVNEWAMRFFRSRLLDDAVGGAAREYVTARGMSADISDRFALGLAAGEGPELREAARRANIDPEWLVAADLVRRSESGRIYDTFRDRLMFPIRDSMNRVVGFGGRTLADDRAKYLNTRQNAIFDKGRGLYGVDLARPVLAERGRVVVVEGYTDCIAAHQAGFAETVATLGTALTEAQVDLLRRYCDRIIILFDSDEAGAAAADRAIQVALPRCVTVQLACIPDGKDPSDFIQSHGADAFSDVLNEAVDALVFKWTLTRKRFSGDSSEAARRESLVDFLRVVAGGVDTTAVDAIQRGLLVNQVAHLLRMDRGEVDHMLVRLQRKGPSRAFGPAGADHADTGTGPGDGEQLAWTTVAEVLLNEPGALETEEVLPDIARIGDERTRRIVGLLLELRRELGEFHLSDVLARMHDPDDLDRVTALAQRGARRGNFQQTLDVALERIRLTMRREQTDKNKERLLEPNDAHASTDEARSRWMAFQEGARCHRSYVPRRLIRPLIKADPPTESLSIDTQEHSE